jgi:F-type H+-transporting ATPase subunit delta
MNGERIAKRYAEALYELCDGSHEQTQNYLAKLQSIVSVFDDADIKRVLNSPVVSADLKKEVLNELAEQVGSDQLLKAFLSEIARANRVALLPGMVTALKNLINQKLGIVEAQAVTVVDLEEEDAHVIRQKLEKLTGKKVYLTSRVDQSILGGFVIRFGNNVLDMSLKSKLDAMTQAAVK